MRFKAAALGVVLVVTAMAWVFLPREEARLVRARVTSAAEALSGRPGEGDLDRLARLAGFAKALAPDIVLEIEPGGPAVRGRDAVAALAGQLASAGAPVRVELSDIAIAFNDTHSRAAVTALAHVTSTASGAIAQFDQDVVRIDLVKSGAEWLIAKATREPALAR